MKKVQELYLLGILITILGAIIVVFSLLFSRSNSLLFLSASYDSLDQLGDAGRRMFVGFSIINGGLAMALGLLVMYVGRNYNPNDMKLVYSAGGVWFVVDTFGSLFYGWEYNVILNIVILSVMLGLVRKAQLENYD